MKTPEESAISIDRRMRLDHMLTFGFAMLTAGFCGGMAWAWQVEKRMTVLEHEKVYLRERTDQSNTQTVQALREMRERIAQLEGLVERKFDRLFADRPRSTGRD